MSDSRSLRASHRPGIWKVESLTSKFSRASDGNLLIESNFSLMREESWSFPDMPLM